MRFIYYRTENGKSPVFKYLNNKGVNFTRAFHKKIFQLQNNPGLITSEHIRDGIIELKIYPQGDVCRPLYASIQENDYLILHVVDHLDGKAEDKAVNTALERLDDWKRRNQ